MSYLIERTNLFKHSYKKCIKRGFDKTKLEKVLTLLCETGKLPPQYHPHKLSGNYADTWECHIEADWLLLWQQDDTRLVLLLIDTGTHSDIF
jgi:mRNA interferase YafQ